MAGQTVAELEQKLDQFRQAYELKVQDLAAETRRMSILMAALEAEGHRADVRDNNRYCPLCVALRDVTG